MFMTVRGGGGGGERGEERRWVVPLPRAHGKRALRARDGPCKIIVYNDSETASARIRCCFGSCFRDDTSKITETGILMGFVYICLRLSMWQFSLR